MITKYHVWKSQKAPELIVFILTFMILLEMNKFNILDKKKYTGWD